MSRNAYTTINLNADVNINVEDALSEMNTDDIIDYIVNDNDLFQELITDTTFIEKFTESFNDEDIMLYSMYSDLKLPNNKQKEHIQFEIGKQYLIRILTNLGPFTIKANCIDINTTATEIDYKYTFKTLDGEVFRINDSDIEVIIATL